MSMHDVTGPHYIYRPCHVIVYSFCLMTTSSKASFCFNSYVEFSGRHSSSSENVLF